MLEAKSLLCFFMRCILLTIFCCCLCQQRSTRDKIKQRLVLILLKIKVRMTEKKNEHKKIKRLNETTRWSLDGTVKLPKYVKKQTNTFSRQYATFFSQQHLLAFNFLLKYVSLDCLTSAEGKHYIYFVYPRATFFCQTGQCTAKGIYLSNN